jgi:mRNA interferase RelE/StbE
VTWRLELAVVGGTLRKLDPPIRRRIVAELLELEKDPFSPGTEKLQGRDELYRRRVGD